MLSKRKLITDYERACNNYANSFAAKQQMEFVGWEGSVGGMAIFDAMTVNFHDLVWDVNSGQPKWRIVEWMDYVFDFCKEHECLNLPVMSQPLNYFDYTKKRDK